MTEVVRDELAAMAIAGAALCFGLRFIAIRRGWRLPVAGQPQQTESGADAAEDERGG